MVWIASKPTGPRKKIKPTDASAPAPAARQAYELHVTSLNRWITSI